MSDFTQIGALVKAGTDLLNSIKGGAILTMQTQFDALKNTISAEWNSIKTQLNNDVSASIARIDTETVINKMGFVAMNYNGDFLDTKVITNSLNEPNTLHENGYGSRTKRRRKDGNYSSSQWLRPSYT
ncbi:hypothetical protein [Vibrio nigripulchritudo]|uniref:hypothetical protein n=1 Tax=Vibrio nigripulchritudo TaxID=28173 RepID=UPI0024924469|nr:hypothetical protein [Vibrio nigripulchritudo]BDU46904.1 hypothetical protein TUMSATVNIG3_57020 [Vibrio nigripulchritudo]